MSLIKPFRGLRPASGHAEDVVAPPYDVLNTAEAREMAQTRPWSFLHISKPEIDLAEGIDPYDPAVYAKGAENLENMISQGILIKEQSPAYYLYRLVMDGHSQTGLVAIASVKDYDSNRIRKHEYTRPDKENDRVNQIDALNAQTGPVFLTYRHHEQVDKLIKQCVQQQPTYDLTAADGVQHTLWILDEPSSIDKLTHYFDDMDCLYIADGHHRSAAGSRVAAMRKQAGKASTGDDSSDYFLSVLFPDNQMQILDYNRVITDLNGLGEEEFLDRVAERFTLTPSELPVKPGKAAEFGMYLGRRWYHLQLGQDKIPSDDPVARLDVSLLANELIEPILNISDPRRDKRIDFVGGIRGLAELEKRVNSGEMAVAFALFPTGLDDLMAVADANDVMPPKSTWFEPKLADGLVSHVLD